MVVREVLKKFGLHFIFIELAEIEVMENISDERSTLLRMELNKSGHDILDDKNAILIENIKDTIIEMIYKNYNLTKINCNRYLSEKFNMDFSELAKVFLSVQRIKIDQYILNHKIDRIKEMIIYEELNNIEIADKLDFSNVAELNLQFKKATGLTLFNFKLMKIKRHRIIEDIINS
jgi:AraC-like DNA-binding protein